MAGPTSLKVAKALLTRYCKNLQRLTEESEKALKTEELKVWNVQKSQDVQRKVMELEANINLVSQSLEKFANVVDNVMDSVTEEQEQQVQKYIDKAQTTIEQAQTLTIQLESARISARDHAGDPTRPTSSSVRGDGEALTSLLPPIPVPTFTGELWDFENFWRLFEANVDCQPLTKLQKFNYLLNALKGEARELINRFTVTEENYEEAIAMLHRKYGDRSRLVAKLQQRLEETHATSTSTAAQRRLLETIIPLISQLEAHKVYLDGSFAAQKLLSKFSASIQRKILQQYITPEMQEENWHMKDIITALDDCISTEERITEMMTTYLGNSSNTYTRRRRTISHEDVDISASCLFCKDTTHRMAACVKLNSIAQRRRFFQESNRCLNCASQGHFVKDCRSPGCRACLGQKHHHSLCPKRNENEGWAQLPQTQTFGTSRNLQSTQQRDTLPPFDAQIAHTSLNAENLRRVPQEEQMRNDGHATVLHAITSLEKRPSEVTQRIPQLNRQKKQEEVEATSTATDTATVLKKKLRSSTSTSDDESDARLPNKLPFSEVPPKHAIVTSNTTPSFFGNPHASNDPPFTKHPATPRTCATSSTSNLNDEERTIRKVWERFLDFKKDVERQQQEMRDWIQTMCDHLTLIAENNTSRPETIRRQKKREKVEGEATRTEQQSLQSQRKKVDEERRRNSKKQSTQQSPRRFLAGLGRNLELTTFAQKEETCEEQRTSIRAAQEKEKNKQCFTLFTAKHTNKDDILRQEKRKSKMILQRKGQEMEIGRNPDYSRTEGRASSVLNKKKMHGLRRVRLAKHYTKSNLGLVKDNCNCACKSCLAGADHLFKDSNVGNRYSDNSTHRCFNKLLTSSRGKNGNMPARNDAQHWSHPRQRMFRSHTLDDFPVCQLPSRAKSAVAGSIADRDAIVRKLRNATRRPLSRHPFASRFKGLLKKEVSCGTPRNESTTPDATFPSTRRSRAMDKNDCSCRTDDGVSKRTSIYT